MRELDTYDMLLGGIGAGMLALIAGMALSSATLVAVASIVSVGLVAVALFGTEVSARARYELDPPLP